MSLLARLLNVFAIPGHVFDELAVTRASFGNWLVPLIITSLIGGFSVLVLYSQPSFQDQIHKLEDKMHKQQSQYLDDRVKSGQMTRDEANQTQALVDKFFTPNTLKLLSMAASFIGVLLSIFGWGFALWFLGRRYLAVRFPYMKAVEAAGLATMISALGVVVKLIIMVNVSKMFTTRSLGLAVSDFNPDDPNYLFLVVINIFQVWFIILLAIALSRLARAPFPRAMFLLLICWMLCAVFLVIIGSGAMVL